MSWRVIVGTLSLVITMILLGYVAVTEQVVPEPGNENYRKAGNCRRPDGRERQFG